MNSMKRQKDKTLEDEAPGLKGFTMLLGNAAKSLQSCQTLYDPSILGGLAENSL